jgi:pimeloyl-ACP methyl ester carboxylesterase
VTLAGAAGRTLSADGTAIAWFRSGDGPPIVLVHGATADHTAWRTAGPLLATSHTLYAIDRRGRGASGDTAPYAIAREYEDVAAVVDAVAVAEGRPVDVVGHSFGGRIGLGATLLTPNLHRLVAYEGAPAPDRRSFHGEAVMARLEALAAADDLEGLLSYFMATVVGMTPEELAAYRVAPTWPARVEAAPTIVREMWAEATEEAGPERYAAIGVPVLQLVGGDSNALFTDGTWALDRLLPNGRVVVIPGAKHAAHHSHPEVFVREVRRFLEDPALVTPIDRPGDQPRRDRGLA